MNLPRAQRVRAWFHNHTRPPTTGSGARGLLKMKGKPKVLQEWQVYHTLTYETQWKTIVDEEWAEYKNTWEAERPGEELDETRFTFMASFMRNKYKEETEDVKETVKKRREEMKAQMEENGEGHEKNESYQEYLNFIH